MLDLSTLRLELVKQSGCHDVKIWSYPTKIDIVIVGNVRTPIQKLINSICVFTPDFEREPLKQIDAKWGVELVMQRKDG